jgi:hypothetical protein
MLEKLQKLWTTLHVDVGESALFAETALKTKINNTKKLKLRKKSLSNTK